MKFPHLQGLRVAMICAFHLASQLPMSLSQEAEIEDYQAEVLPLCNSHSHSEEPGSHHLPFISVLLFSRWHVQRFQLS